MKSKNVKLSVIVPNYNNKKYIIYCLDSILAQSFKDLEIIITDDNSSDGSCEIIESYVNGHNNIDAIYNKQRLGVALNKHNAIMQARGEYITTLDSDDFYYNPEKLQIEIELIDRYLIKAKNDVLSFSNIVWVDEIGNFIKEVMNSHNTKEGMILYEILSRSCAIPRDFILKKTQYFDVGGFDSSMTIFEDWDIKTRLASKYEYRYTGVAGTAYRQHSAGLSKSGLNVNVKYLRLSFQKNINLLSGFSKVKAYFKVMLIVSKLIAKSYFRGTK